jgi:hypothetical protein
MFKEIGIIIYEGREEFSICLYDKEIEEVLT